MVWALAVLAAALPCSEAVAQAGLQNVVSTVGTTARDESGRVWAYLFWQGTTPELVLGRSYAIYVKAGGLNSTAPYTRVSVVAQQTDPRNIEPLLRRAVHVGENLAKLEEDLHSLFEALMPAGNISRAEKLSAAIRGSLAEEEYFQNMQLMARMHPGVALALGMAYCGLLTEPSTYEVRLFDPASETDSGVVGRVALDPHSTLILPAPGAPVEVPDPSPKGDINIKLRWATPDSLRRLSLLHYGFNVWRVTRAYAEAASNRWDVTPPAASVLAARAALEPQHVKRCNNLPILTSKDFSFSDVADFSPAPAGDPETYFYADDDGRFRPGYVNLGFTNGAQFYYFVSARDILGRDGRVSSGTLLTVCDRQPPFPPDGVRVVNDYSFVNGSPRQFLRVIWNQNTNTLDPVTSYWVYRWTSVAEMQAKAGNPTNNRIAGVNHTDGVATASYLDDGPGAPSVPADLGRTYWYTVRALDQGACGPNISANSAPAFGVLRDREGPPAPSGEIKIYCLEPRIYFRNIPDPSGNLGTPGEFTFQLNAMRTSRAIAQVAFVAGIFDRAGQPLEQHMSDWLHYSPGQDIRHYTFTTAGRHQGLLMVIYALAGTFDGRFAISEEKYVVLQEPWISDLVYINYEAGLGGSTQTVGEGCATHYPVTPEGTKTNIVVVGYPSLGSEEWRIYRRVDDGPLTLMCEGAVNGAQSFSCEDDGLPPNGATICYYLQVLDEHGNPSPMVKLGCVTSASVAPPPAPLLSRPFATGVTNLPGMTLRWFAPPPGVERFEVWIAGDPLGVDSQIAPDLLALRPVTAFQTNPVPQTVVVEGQTNTYDFHVFLTPRVGPGFGPGPEFAVPCQIELGNTYTVFVKAVSKDGTVSEPSNIEQFTWNPAQTNYPICTIPWPARGLPALNENPAFGVFDTNVSFGITATYVQSASASFTGAVVSVGGAIFRRSGGAGVNERPQWIEGAVDPMTFVFTNLQGESLFPIVLYRYQVPNSQFPVVSGDIIQVSPMLENISYQITNYTVVLGSTVLHITNSLLRDSYILYDLIPLGDKLGVFAMFVPDTQPVIAGARYRYLLVRFREDGEIEEVIATNEMEVP